VRSPNAGQNPPMPTPRSLITDRLSLTGGLAAGVVLLAACGSASSAGQPATTAAPTLKAVALVDLFVTAIPSGFTLQPDSVGDTGPSDLAKAARDDGSAGAAALLTQDGFVAGYQRLWAQKSDGTYVVIFLYRFDNPAGAKSYEQHGVGLMTADPSGPKTSVSVPGISGATGLTGTVQGRPVDAVAYAKDDYVVQVGMQGTSASPGVAIQLAQDQFARLP
jgi:hypothetical protein